jgi:hypothetical protein
MSKRKKDDTVYTIQITGEQIKTIRSIYNRVELVYGRRGAAEVIQEDGHVERIPFYECYFCGQASYKGADDISHTKDCIITLANAEFHALNAQFIALDRKGDTDA